MKKITPCLWFDNQAEKAANFYISIFKKSKIVSIARYGKEGSKVSGRPKGTVMTVAFQLEGQEFLALNGGPQFKFTEAISFIVNCKTQKEIDEFWRKLSDGGEKRPAWLKDDMGFHGRSFPLPGDVATKIRGNLKKLKASMKKLDIKVLKQAFEQQ
jgi:predicted 3-demethylubiquinone-9 3-methyltransferase (glyoxalase superfamily)